MIFKIKHKITGLLESYGFDKLILNSGSIFFRRVFGLGLSFLWIFAITNWFGAETYGLVSLGQVVISFSGMVFGLGLDAAIVKLGSTNDHYQDGVLQSNFLKKILILGIVSALICSLLFYVLRDVIAENIFQNKDFSNYLVVISYFLFLFFTHKITVSFLSVKEEFVKYANFYFIFPNVLILIFIGLIYFLKLPYYFIIGGYLLSYGVFGITLLISFLKLPKKIRLNVSYESILKLSTPMMVSASFLFISNWTDVFMLGAMVEKSELGIYNVAFKLASLALIIIATVNTVLAPKLSKYYSLNDIPKIKREVEKATKIITYMALPLVAVLIIFRKPILGLFGDEFIFGQTTLVIISIGMLFNAMSGSVAQILNMTKFQREFRNLTLLSAVLNIILNYFLIKKYGINGAAIASLISNVALNSICIIYIRKEFGFYSFFKLKY